jgi:phosphohistidine phosphatase
MTKIFLLVRHSKAEDRNNITNDIDRPLSDEGIADSFQMATLLLNSGIIPDVILASSAARAIHTAHIFLQILNISEKKLIISENLYYSASKTILDQISDLPDTINCVMVVAHNPGISALVRSLSSGRANFMVNSQMAIMKFEIEKWHQLHEQKPVVFWTHKPDGKSL